MEEEVGKHRDTLAGVVVEPLASYTIGRVQKDWDKSLAGFNDVIERYRPESFGSTEWQNIELKPGDTVIVP
jgi:hypothetical protein